MGKFGGFTILWVRMTKLSIDNQRCGVNLTVFRQTCRSMDENQQKNSYSAREYRVFGLVKKENITNRGVMLIYQ